MVYSVIDCFHEVYQNGETDHYQLHIWFDANMEGLPYGGELGWLGGLALVGEMIFIPRS